LGEETKTKETIETKLKVGAIGYSLNTINQDKRGFCYFDGERHEVKAGSYVRKWAEVILITTVPEPTVIETWSVFPLSYELADGGFQTVGVNTPLPVTGGSRAITVKTIEVTAVDTTEIIAPSSGKKIRVHFFLYSNKHTTVASVALTFKESPETDDLKYRAALAADGGAIPCNLFDCNLEGEVDETLYAYAAAAYAGGVFVTVGYSER